MHVPVPITFLLQLTTIGLISGMGLEKHCNDDYCNCAYNSMASSYMHLCSQLSSSLGSITINHYSLIQAPTSCNVIIIIVYRHVCALLLIFVSTPPIQHMYALNFVPCRLAPKLL